MTPLQKTFIENLRAERSRVGLTQESLAEKVNISHKYYGAIELGYKFPSIKVIEKIAQVLSIAPYRLFLDTPTMDKGNAKSIETVDKYNQYIEENIHEYLSQIRKNYLNPNS